MKITIKLITPNAYGVIVDEKTVYSTGDVKSICNYCKNHFNIDVPTIVKRTTGDLRRYFYGLTKDGFIFDI